MKVYIMTDLECVAGVVSLPEYCLFRATNKYGFADVGRYYEHARELLTLEVNAAVEGLLEGGATEILVCDGHGHGSINPALLHSSARVLCGKPLNYPMQLDQTFDATIMIGQHARGNTDGGHLCHSGSFNRESWQLNGREIGEIDLWMLQAAYFKVPMVMLSGDRAACDEVRALAPSISTVPVIEGIRRGSTAGMTAQQAIDWNVPAIHVAPVRARQMIRDAAKKCLELRNRVERPWIEPPYEMVRITRQEPDQERKRAVNRSSDLIALLQQPAQYGSS